MIQSMVHQSRVHSQAFVVSQYWTLFYDFYVASKSLERRAIQKMNNMRTVADNNFPRMFQLMIPAV